MLNKYYTIGKSFITASGSVTNGKFIILQLVFQVLAVNTGYFSYRY